MERVNLATESLILPYAFIKILMYSKLQKGHWRLLLVVIEENIYDKLLSF